MSKRFNLIQAIEFEPYTQEDIEALILADLKVDLPEGVNVSNIEFIQKRNPTRIEAVIVGAFGGTAKKTTVPETATKEAPAEEQLSFDEEPEPEISRDGVLTAETTLIDEVLNEEASDIADIFKMP